MKKLALTITITAIAVSSHAQGYVTVAGTMQNFTNNALLSSSWAGGSNVLGGFASGVLNKSSSGDLYKVALLALTGNENLHLFGDSTLTSDWGFTGLEGGNTPFSGRLSIGTDLQTASFAPIGVSTTFLLLAWSPNLGSLTTVEQDLAGGSFNDFGYVGWSLAGTGVPGAAPPATALTIQGASGSIIPGGITMLNTAPEPTTLALAGLGALSMLFLRRRKS